MIHSPTLPPLTCGARVRRARECAGLSRAALSEISGVDPGFIQAVEHDALCQLISAQEIEYAVSRFNGRGPQRVMQRTLLRWAADLHRLADALADTFENLFPAADLATLSDRLWHKIHCTQRQHPAHDHQPPPPLPDNPWHDWGWFRHVALSDDLVDDTFSADPFETGEVLSLVREYLARLTPRERLILTKHCGLDGLNATLDEIGQLLGLTAKQVRRIEQRALRRLKQANYCRRSCDELD